MNIEEVLDSSTSRLRAAGIGTARLDILVMLQDLLERDRSWVLAHSEIVLSGKQLQKFQSWLMRRANHEPLAHIRGYSEFYGRLFKVNKHVLQPRPESETMIDFLKDLRNLPMRLRIADVGTGSGALGITAALELPAAQVDLYEIDGDAIEVAKMNIALHDLNVQTFESDLLGPRMRQYDVILANLPYIPARYRINEAAQFEPTIALYGGGDGLQIYRRLFNQVSSISLRPSYVLTESLPFQHSELSSIAATAGYQLDKKQDFIQVFKLG